MLDKVIVAGFGGQGIISLGKIMAYLAMKDNKNVTHFPSYGAEMRGGTANCSVILSDEVIFSPIFTHPTTLIVMNNPSQIKFTPMLAKNGLLILDSTHVKISTKRDDIRIVSAPATEEANKLGNVKTANIILLGIYVKSTNFFNKKFAEDSIKNYFGNKKKSVIDMNLGAFEIGYNLV